MTRWSLSISRAFYMVCPWSFHLVVMHDIGLLCATVGVFSVTNQQLMSALGLRMECSTLSSSVSMWLLYVFGSVSDVRRLCVDRSGHGSGFAVEREAHQGLNVIICQDHVTGERRPN